MNGNLYFYVIHYLSKTYDRNADLAEFMVRIESPSVWGSKYRSSPIRANE